MYTVNSAGPACKIVEAPGLSPAVSRMESAHTDAAGSITPDSINLGAGSIGGNTLTQVLYKWTSGLLITKNITFSAYENDVWIFQILGTLDVSSTVNIILADGAQAKNVF
ncbi:MAG: hypothetical protein ACI86L_001616 [Dokdonia sp.]|jgi:hypothetical protein